MGGHFLEAQKELSRTRANNIEPMRKYASVATNKQSLNLNRKPKPSHVVLIKANTAPLNIQEEVMKAFDPVTLRIGVGNPHFLQRRRPRHRDKRLRF